MSNVKTAVLLVNLGTPDEPSPAGVRSFLKPFLSDKRVVEIPSLVWWPILNGLILPFRPKRVADAYQSIWTEQGSPLRVITEKLTQGLDEYLKQTEIFDVMGAVQTEYAMTYGEPSIAKQLELLRSNGAEKIVVIPLYPQYSATTTAAVSDQLAQWQLKQREIADLRLCKFYYDQADYQEALANSVRQYWQNNKPAEKLLLSFHGIPKRCVDLGDPYYEQCLATAKSLADSLNLNDQQWGISFQSRLGKAEWLKPYTTEVVEQWAKQGVKSIDAICPAFAVDCLETLEEIAVEAGEIFKQSGGEVFHYIPCLNDDAEQIKVFANISKKLSVY